MGIQASVYPDPWTNVPVGNASLAMGGSTASAAGTYPGGQPPGGSATGQIGLDYDPDYWLVEGAVGLEFRCIWRIAINGTAPGRDLTLELREMIASSGGAGQSVGTFGPAIPGTEHTFVTPGPGIGPKFECDPIESPPAGIYSPCVTVAGALVAASRLVFWPQVQVRNIFP